MLNFSKSVQLKKQTYLHLVWSEDQFIFSTFLISGMHELTLLCYTVPFLVPSAITFNSKTANPWLSLTSSLTCVRYQIFNIAIQDNPQRFNAALSLLGSQGFTKGRHYWEVEVYSSTVWTVGVARESVTRKGVINAMPANGFWTLSLSYGVQYMAGTSPPTLLSLEEPLARIGVYLDYKRGLVSFYNAESMTHLYTFKDIFTETLYPYFNLGFLDKVHENEPLKVFLPKIW